MARIRLVLGVIAAAVVAGCTSGNAYRVTIVTDPPGANVAVARGDEPYRGREHGAPFTERLSFGERASSYRIIAKPTERLAETHVDTELTVTEGMLARLGENKQCTVTIELKVREWIDMRTKELVFDPVLGWRGFETKHRAYTTVREPNDVTPDKVAVLYDNSMADYDGFRGVSLSPTGASVVLAVFSLFPPDTPPSPSQLREMQKRKEDTSKFPPRMAWLPRIRYSHLRSQILEANASSHLLRDGINFDPVLTHGGAGVLYVADSDGDGHSRLLERRSLDGISVSTFSDRERDEAVFYPSFRGDLSSPNYSYIFSVQDDGWSTLADTKIRRLSPAHHGSKTDVGSGCHPQLSPDGELIAYIKDGNLWVQGINGTNDIQYTQNAHAIRQRFEAYVAKNPEDLARWTEYERDRLFLANSYPTWTADGRWILFTSMEAADETGRPQMDIYAIDSRLESKQATRRLTSNFSADCMPMVSPDGKWFCFVSNRGKQWAVWRLPLPSDMAPE